MAKDTGDAPNRGAGDASGAEAEGRRARLAAQLRANLRRRKDQARARRDAPDDGRDPAAEPPQDAD